MANRSGPRPRRGGGPRRGPSRVPRRPRQQDFPESEKLGGEEVKCDSKTVLIDFRHNNQGQFIQLSEAEVRQRSRINMNMESAQQMRKVFNEFLKDIDNIVKVTPSEHEPLAECEPFSQGKRKYFIEIRENERGKFVKIKAVTVRNYAMVYIAFPLENFQEFVTKFSDLYDIHYNPQDNDTPPSSPSNLPSSREVRAGGKSFFFDVEKNDRGVFVRLKEVVHNIGKRTYINIPNSCWSQMADVFGQLAQEVPYEEPSGSGSEDN